MSGHNPTYESGQLAQEQACRFCVRSWTPPLQAEETQGWRKQPGLAQAARAGQARQPEEQASPWWQQEAKRLMELHLGSVAETSK